MKLNSSEQAFVNLGAVVMKSQIISALLQYSLKNPMKTMLEAYNDLLPLILQMELSEEEDKQA